MKMTLRKILEDYHLLLNDDMNTKEIDNIYEQLIKQDHTGLLKGLQQSFEGFISEVKTDKKRFLQEISFIEFNKHSLHIGNLTLLPISCHFLNFFSDYISKKCECDLDLYWNLDWQYINGEKEYIQESTDIGKKLFSILRTISIDEKHFKEEETKKILNQMNKNDSMGLFQYFKEILQTNIPKSETQYQKKLTIETEDLKIYTPHFDVSKSSEYFTASMLFLKFFISRICDQEIEIDMKPPKAKQTKGEIDE